MSKCYKLEQGFRVTFSYGKPENPVTFICVETSLKGVTQIKQMNYIQIIIWVTQSLTSLFTGQYNTKGYEMVTDQIHTHL